MLVKELNRCSASEHFHCGHFSVSQEFSFVRLCVYDPRTRSFIFFIIFIPSSRKILFFQKKVRLLNEQFITFVMVNHSKDNLALSDVDPLTELKTMRKMAGTYKNIR